MTLCDHQVNVVKGLKIYEDVFTTSEIMKVADFINEIRQAGRNGELSGKLFFYFRSFLIECAYKSLKFSVYFHWCCLLFLDLFFWLLLLVSPNLWYVFKRNKISVIYHPIDALRYQKCSYA